MRNGEVSRDVQGLQTAEFYSSAVERMENFIPHPQGKASLRPGMRHLNQTFGTPTRSIAFNASNGEGFVLVLEAGGFIAYDVNGRVQQRIDVDQSNTVSSTYLGGNDFEFQFAGGHGVLNNQLVNADVVVTDAVTGVTFELQIQGLVSNVDGSFSPSSFTVRFDENPINSLATGSTFTFDNVIQLGGAQTETVLDDENIQYVQIGNEIFIISNNTPGLFRITYNPDIAPSGRFSGALVGIPEFLNPTAIGFFEQRLVIGEGNRVLFSETNNFLNFTTGIEANDPIAYTIAGANNNAADVLWIKANERFLLVGTLSGNYVVRGANEADPISPNSINIRPIDSLGSAPVYAINSDSRVYFVERGRDTLRALEFNFAIRGFSTLDLNILTKHIGEERIRRIEFFQDDPNRLLVVLESGTMAMVVLDRETAQIAWCRINHGDGKIIDANVAFDGNGEDRAFLIVQRVVNGATVHSIEIMDLEIFYKSFDDFYTGDEEGDNLNYKNYLSEVQASDVRLDSRVVFSPIIDGETSVATTLGGQTFFIGVVGNVEQEILPGDRILESDGPGVFEVIDVGGSNVTGNIITDFSAPGFPTGGVFLERPVLTYPHLSGAAVKIVSEGMVFERTFETDGTLDITDLDLSNKQISKIHVGIAFRGLIKTLPLRGFAQLGETDFKYKDVSSLFFKIDESLGFKYGTDPYDLQNLELDTEYNPMFPNGCLFSGVTEELYIETDAEREVNLYFVQDNPFPVNIVSYGFHIRSEDI